MMRCHRVGAVIVVLAGALVPAAGFTTQPLERLALRGSTPYHRRNSDAALPALSPFEGKEQEQESFSWLPSSSAWRGFVASFAAVLVVFSGSLRSVHAEQAAASAPPAQPASSVQLYFGQGCFWHVQHELVSKEVKDLGRGADEVTALSGYAGGTKKADSVCYHTFPFAPTDYSTLGHTEVVSVSVPEDKVGDFAKLILDAGARYPFGRADPQDMGSEYRSAIGLPGGTQSPLYKQIEEANAGRLRLVAGKGNDDDTLASKKVWVYDSDKFPFYQAEVYHQFHDDMTERYSRQYHQIKGSLVKNGKIKSVECPELGF